MGDLLVERLVDINSKSLNYILSRKDRITLLDTCIFSIHTNNFSKLIHMHPSSSDINYFNDYFGYLTVLFDAINLNDNVLTIPEIIETELFSLRNMFRKEKKFFSNILSLFTKYSNVNKDNVKIISTHIKNIDAYLTTIMKIVSKKELYNKIQDDYRLYEFYKKFVNRAYYLFRDKNNGKKDDSICADDGLVAASVMLSKQTNIPTNIISNDTGVSKRVRIFKSVINQFKDWDKDGIIKELNNLVDLDMIHVYTDLEDNVTYQPSRITKKNRNIHCLNYKKCNETKYSDSEFNFHLNCLWHDLERINSLEQRMQ